MFSKSKKHAKVFTVKYRLNGHPKLSFFFAHTEVLTPHSAWVLVCAELGILLLDSQLLPETAALMGLTDVEVLPEL